MTEERDIQSAHSEFVVFKKAEMDAKLPKRNQFKSTAPYKPHK